MGGVLAMNAGAFDFSVGNWVEDVTVVSPLGEKLLLPRGRIDFRYRTSSLGDDFVVAACRMKLAEDDPRAIRTDMDKQMTVRRSSQPVGVKSAGCIFKNPSGDSAGRLIDSLGMKGFCVGGARVSEVHANFIVHDGKATTLDVLTLIEQIKEKVLRETSIELVEEVRQWA
jgi:UDP-N-acetylmuramate dehydrogenase